MAEEAPIPRPAGLPIIGNVVNLDSENPVASLTKMSKQYGDIYSLRLGGQDLIIISSEALASEITDEKRFQKAAVAGRILKEVSNGVHDGLFTAENSAPRWGVAHRILMPAFGPLSMQGMFSEMHEVGTQLALKWARHISEPIHVTDDFTRLTLDTLALCAMGFRFNSFYHDDLHPFINAMTDFLTACGDRSRRPPLTGMFFRAANQKYSEDIAILRKTAEEVLQERRKNPSDRKDLMQAMINGVDPKTGQKMEDDSIVDNLITFLIAGHETTSGMLSFVFYQLISHPEVYKRAQKEVDDVVGTGHLTVEHLSKLPYMDAVFRETLRQSPTIPGINLVMNKDIEEDSILIGDGKYRITKDMDVFLLFSRIQADPKVYGSTAEDFDPDRMSDENFEKLMKEHPAAWKPFGNGVRGCIGRPFAWQEAKIAVAILLQNFNFFYDDPSYTLRIKETLTMKPKDFHMRAVLRNGLTATDLEHRLAGRSAQVTTGHAAHGHVAIRNGVKGKPMSIYYGSNTGTCEALAQRLAGDAPSHGFHATTVEPLDAANQNLPRDRPVVFTTASYEGQPPDNAALFVNWIGGLKDKELEGVSYAVFGCGHHDWAQSFHRVPKLVDSSMEAGGGDRLAPIGLADAARGEMFTDFEQWEDDVLWPALSEKYGVTQDEDMETAIPSLGIKFSAPRSAALRQDVNEALVVETKVLTGPDASPKKHMEIQLPSTLSYRAGDYLTILPLNPRATISRAMRRFQIAWDAHITIEAQGRSTLPANVPLSVNDVLGAYVELSQPATKRGILALVEATADGGTKARLKALAGDDYTAEISRKRVSILDLLERFSSIALPFGTFLALLPPMRVRQYSISSSPLWDSSRVTITYSLLSAPSHSNPDQQHTGVATSYLASLAAGDKLNVGIRSSVAAFHLPTAADSTPIICIAAGSGIAPFRGFMQERAAQVGAGRQLAPALLFFGCRGPELDDLYRAELGRWQAMGAVDVRRAYSRVDLAGSTAADAKGCKHVHDRLWHDREAVNELWEKGAQIYVCGSREVGESVKKAALRMAEEKMENKDYTEEEKSKRLEVWFSGIRNTRYATDVFD